MIMKKRGWLILISLLLLLSGCNTKKSVEAEKGEKPVQEEQQTKTTTTEGESPMYPKSG